MTESRKDRLRHVLRYRQNDLTVILENVADPHNIFAVMRSCDAVGISEIYVINTSDILFSQWGEKSSSSARKWIIVHHFQDIKTCMEAVRKKYQQVASTHLAEGSKSLYDIDFTLPTALAFGNERKGLSKEILAYCDFNYTIPQIGMISSLNISVACAVSIYEGYRQKEIVGHYDKIKLSDTEMTELKAYWNEERFDEKLT
jgi:tRNA (guanosine-2'-O-)-methyltransferase